jgi:hypothetical protein
MHYEKKNNQNTCFGFLLKERKTFSKATIPYFRST